MYRVGKVEPEWLGPIESTDREDKRPFLLPGIRMQFAPIGTKAVRASRRAAAEKLGIDPEDLEEAGDELSRELLRRGIIGWEGIGPADRDDDEPLPVNPETIEWIIANPDLFEAAEAAYVVPYMLRQREGNVSGPSPSGTGAGATPGADTATSPATQRPKGDASRTRKPKRKAARTSSMSQELTKAPTSGKSSKTAEAS